jgi:SAM-dependent methyltransferase
MTLAVGLRLMASLSEACEYGRMRADRAGDLATDPAAPADATTARYDGWADWYDNWNAPSAARNTSEVLDFLGAGAGLCLDLGCGTGLYFDVLAESGRTVVGLDRSADQLRIAHGRSRDVVQADATALPFANEAFGTVATMWMSTDVNDRRCAGGSSASPGAKRAAVFLRRPPLLQRAPRRVDRRWGHSRASDLPHGWLA